MPYVDLSSVHTPSTGTIAPATWGTTIRSNFEFLIDPPACSVYNDAVVSVAAGASVMAANSENFDNDGMHSTVTNNSRITIVTAGRYLFICTIYIAASMTNRSATMLLNGVTVYEGTSVTNGNGTDASYLTAARTIDMAAGEYVQARVWQNSGGAINAHLQEFTATYLTR